MKKFILLLCFVLLGVNVHAQLSEPQRKAAIEEIVDRIELPEIPDYEVSILEFGAKGDSISNNKRALTGR
jgi:hypothetical protein